MGFNLQFFFLVESDVAYFSFSNEDFLPNGYILLNNFRAEGLSFVCVTRSGTLSILSEDKNVRIRQLHLSVFHLFLCLFSSIFLTPCVFLFSFFLQSLLPFLLLSSFPPSLAPSSSPVTVDRPLCHN